MAHFYASIEGNRGMATRCGTKSSGITGHVRGWTVGARVELSHEDGTDIARVYRTGGSNGYGTGELVAQFDGDGNLFYGAHDPAQRLRDAFADALAAGVDVWPILADTAFSPVAMAS